ncbi:hypothetical protein BN946_scf184706.g6 [Trametes cinnabarina]|uniref:Uncharacterized protein n=1 Tax=Pycnoporus cinnabarinus TaxID=5643 RepID=A0A060SK92_PYCCI|nr:hypothetical protein BN946_scf184706.g6 [Trametes cinnabarina]
MSPPSVSSSRKRPNTIATAVSKSTYHAHARHRHNTLENALGRDLDAALRRGNTGPNRQAPGAGNGGQEQVLRKRQRIQPPSEDPHAPHEPVAPTLVDAVDCAQSSPRGVRDSSPEQDDCAQDLATIHEEEPRVGTADAAPPQARREDLKNQQTFISLLQEATLEKSGMDPEEIARLRNPPRTLPDIVEDTQLRLWLRTYLANGHSEESYRANRDAINEYSPTAEVPTYERMQRVVAQITGVVPLETDMCIRSCLAYTGPYADLDSCPFCPTNEPRYKTQGKKRLARRTFSTLLFGPQVQHMYLSRESAEDLGWRARVTEELLELLNTGQPLGDLKDYCWGTDYLEAVQNDLISTDDMLLLFSIDGAQLYESKMSDCWVYIWVIFELGPDKRYKKRYVLPGAVIPGPEKPKNIESFIFPGLYHIAALQHEGLTIWDAFAQRLFTSKPIIILATADGPGMSGINGLVGHSGAQGCRLYCLLRGRRKPRGSHYYPAMLKPLNYYERGCDHPDVSFETILQTVPGLTWSQSVEGRYNENLAHVLRSTTHADYDRRRLETGISEPSIFSGLPLNFGIPRCFPGDIMHHISLNLGDLFVPLLRGTFRCDRTDDVETWDWACLRSDEAWQAHGDLVAQAATCLPASFGRFPRNPAEKIHSGYKAWEFQYYLFGLLPGLLWSVWSPAYHQHFCKLVSGVRTALLLVIPTDERQRAHQHLLEFVREYEEKYYQRRADRLHFVRQSIHALVHLIPEQKRLGPGSLHSQWTIENYIGNITREIGSDKEPYANLAQRAARRAHSNVLQAMFPSFVPPGDVLPPGAVPLGNDYILLRARDRAARTVSGLEGQALTRFLATSGVNLPGWKPAVWKWARLRLPNGQVARCAWKENEREQGDQHLRDGNFAEVRYFFRLELEEGEIKTLVMLSKFTEPDRDILTATHGVLMVCQSQEETSREVVDVAKIIGVVGMVPLPPRCTEAAHVHSGTIHSNRYFVVEKLSIDNSWIGREDLLDDADDPEGDTGAEGR